MRKRNDHLHSSELTLGGRFAAAFASLLFSGPVVGLMWWMGSRATGGLPGSLLWLTVLGIAAIAFAAPGLGPAMFAGLWRVLKRAYPWV